jgi:hypothetical protein
MAPGVSSPVFFLAALFLLATLMLLSLMMRSERRFPRVRTSLLTATAGLAIVALSAGLGGCGGYSSGAPANRGTATINVVAQSGNISHATVVSVTVQ